jgi:hypothetical protein
MLTQMKAPFDGTSGCRYYIYHRQHTLRQPSRLPIHVTRFCPIRDRPAGRPLSEEKLDGFIFSSHNNTEHVSQRILSTCPVYFVNEAQIILK